MNRKITLSFIITLIFCLSLQAYLTKGIFLWDSHGAMLVPPGPYLLIPFILSLVLKYLLKLEFSAWGFLAWLWVLFFSDWLDRPYNYMQGFTIRGEVILFSIVTFFILRSKKISLFYLLPVAGIFVCASSFLTLSGGKIIFTDDHTTFFFRFQQLKGNFPNIPFYYPLWNAGSDARDYFATGALNIFTIFSPLIYAFPLEKVYNYIIVLLFFVFHPLAIYFAARLNKIPSPGPAIASALSLCLSLSWYRWALQYGTLGFITSLALMPFNLVCVSYILDDKEEVSKKLSVIFIITFSLMLFWSLSGFVFVPAIIMAVYKAKKLIFKKNIPLIAFFIILINVPWVISFWSVSNVAKFVTENNENHKSAVEHEALDPGDGSTIQILKNYQKKSVKTIRENVLQINPLLIIFGGLGLFLYSQRANRLFLLTGIWLVCIGAFISPLKPKLELDRMFVILSLMLTLPTARSILSFFELSEKGSRRFSKQVAVSLAGGFLITSLLIASSITSNRSLLRYFFANENVEKITDIIKNNGTEGRILFSGFVLHELSNGHLAPLTYYTNVPLMASSHVHNQWKYKQIVPAEYLKKGETGIEEYLSDFNVSGIFAHEKYWYDYFKAHPEKYQETDEAGRFKFFKRLSFKNNYFLEGEGEFISQDTNSVTIKVNSRDAVLKFVYFNFLASSSCDIGKLQKTSDISLITLSNCTPGTTVTIKSVPLLQRLAKDL